MKGRSLLKMAALAVLGTLSGGYASAQAPLKENIGGNLGAVRFAVTMPSSVRGVKTITYASWAPAITTPMIDVPVEKAYDTLASTSLLNGTGSYPSLSGKFALVFRGGGINFSDKVQRCITAGAAGVIVVNNVPGSPIAMGAVPSTYTSTVPVLMVTDVEGLAINAAVKASTGPSDAVKITIGTWRLGGTHDLGIVTRYLPLPSALNMPISQMNGTTGTVLNNHYMAAAIANYGTATETSINVTDSVYWTAKGSSTSTFVTANTVNIPSIAPGDSIKFGFNTAAYTIAGPTGPGKYEHIYSISYPNTDDFPQDNRYILNQMITDSVYSKVPLDPTTGKITYQSGYGPADGTTTAQALVGSMMYVAKADPTNYKFMQYAVSQKDVTALPKGARIFTHILKWKDGVGGDADSFVEAGELTPVGISVYTFGSTDTSGDVFTARMLNTADPGDTSLKVALEANTWYALVVEVPATYYLGYNERTSSFTRAYAQFKAGGSKAGSGIAERDEMARFTEDLSTALGTATNLFVNYPFGAVAGSTPPTTNLFVDSIFYDRYNKIPAIALITTPNPLSVFESSKKIAGTMTLYPVPASNTLTVAMNLEQTEKEVEFRLFDALGRSVYAEKRTNVRNDKFDIDLTKMAPGNYHLVAVTNEGMMGKSIVIAK